jgi:hypothetical protein
LLLSPCICYLTPLSPQGGSLPKRELSHSSASPGTQLASPQTTEPSQALSKHSVITYSTSSPLCRTYISQPVPTQQLLSDSGWLSQLRHNHHPCYDMSNISRLRFRRLLCRSQFHRFNESIAYFPFYRRSTCVVYHLLRRDEYCSIYIACSLFAMGAYDVNSVILG